MTFLTAAGILLFGLLIGTFINYAADVLPRTRRFTPALCKQCECQAAWLDYLLLHPCRNCGKRRSARAWVTPLLSAAALEAFWQYPSPRLSFLAGLVLLAYFGVVIVIDIEHRLILNPVSLVGAVLGGGLGMLRHGWLTTLLGGLAGFGIMLALYLFGYLFAKGLGKMRGQAIDEEALGFGDVNLAGVLGLLLGWPGIGLGLVYAILIGGAGSLLAVVGMLIARKFHLFQAIPYGPFLIAGALVVLLMR